MSILLIFLDDPDFIFCEVVEVVNEVVDPAVGGVDLAFEVGLFVVRPVASLKNVTEGVVLEGNIDS